MKEFNIQKYDRRRPIVIYGASTYGTYVWQALKKNGIEPECFCDKKKAGERYHDKPVYTYEYILKLKNPVVLIAVGAAFNEVCEFLKSKEIIDVYSIYEFVFEDTCFEKQELIGLGKDRDYYKKLYQFGMEYKVDDGKIRIHTLDWVITEKCSLKCRDCSNLMQYYKKPENIYIEQLKDEMYNLLKVVDEIMDLRIIGGEPFMHTEMFNIIREFLLCEQIKNVSIFTNATILPDNKMIALLKNKKTQCIVSDYGDLVKNYSGFINIMECEDIRYRITYNEKWHDLGALEKRDVTLDEVKKTYSMCECNDLITLLKGKIYRCPYSAHGRNLEAIPYNEEDVVDLYGSTEYVKNKLKFLMFEKKFDYACGYCSGRNFKLGSVEPAIQIEQPLEYKKYYE